MPAGTWNSSNGPTGDPYHHHKAGLSYTQQHGHYHTPETTCTGTYKRHITKKPPLRNEGNCMWDCNCAVNCISWVGCYLLSSYSFSLMCQQASSVGAVLSVQAGTAQRTVTAATGTTVSSATVRGCANLAVTKDWRDGAEHLASCFSWRVCKYINITSSYMFWELLKNELLT